MHLLNIGINFRRRNNYKYFHSIVENNLFFITDKIINDVDTPRNYYWINTGFVWRKTYKQTWKLETIKTYCNGLTSVGKALGKMHVNRNELEYKTLWKEFTKIKIKSKRKLMEIKVNHVRLVIEMAKKEVILIGRGHNLRVQTKKCYFS